MSSFVAISPRARHISREQTRGRAADVAAIAAILLSGAVSTVWAFLVPIFQAPDEPAHFDYAISIFSAHRLIRLRDGSPDWIVSPYAKYLLRISDFERLAWHSSMRVARGYGSRAYYARVDAGAPSLRRPALPNGRISYIVPLYPFGFYALEAVWMGAISLFTGSIVTVFFAARLLCVFLTMLGLYFNYRTALNLGIARWTSVALVGAIGLFPMTSFVSSYVQPDNLAYALVSASLFFATQLRVGHVRLRAVALLGISLGLLAITKPQFFVATAIPILVLCALRFAQMKATAPQRIAAAALLLAPTIALVAFQHWAVDGSGAATGSGIFSGRTLDDLRSAMALGVRATLHYLVGAAAGGFLNCFVYGECAATFWQVLELKDTPLVILNALAEMWLRATISLTTIAVAIVLTFYFGRNALRLLVLATRRRARSAVRIAAWDPVINGYLCFIAIMIALYALTNNNYGAQGRHWYPYIFPAFLCFVWYAPRALNKRNRAASAVLACVLLSYAVLAASYAFIDVQRRYYGPQIAGYVAIDPRPSQIVPGHAVGALLPLQTASYQVIPPGAAPFAFARGSRLVAAGAALPDLTGGPPGVAVILDGHLAMPVLSGQYVLDIAEATRSMALGYSGFYATIVTTHLLEGAHTVAAYARLPGTGRYQRLTPTRPFFLTTRGGRFSAPFLRTLGRAPSIAGSVGGAGVCKGTSSTAQEVLTADSGAVLVLTGELASEPQGRRYSGVWLLVDGRPYPTRYNALNRSFVGTLPTADLAPGIYRVFAYAAAENMSRNDRISQSLVFRVVLGHGESEFLPDPPTACADPLRELAGA